MKSSNPVLNKHQDRIVSAIVIRHQSTGQPVALADLDFFGALSRSEKISLGRGFKKAVDAGQVDGIRHHGRRKDNHATYIPTGSGGGSGGFLTSIKRLFGG